MSGLHQKAVNEAISGPYVSLEHPDGLSISAGRSREADAYVAFVTTREQHTETSVFRRTEVLQAFKLIEGLT